MSLGSLWESFTGLFTKDTPQQASIISPSVAPRAGDVIANQTLLSSNPSQSDWWLDPRVAPQPTGTGFLDSLWSGFKTASSAVSEKVSGIWSEIKEVAPEAVSLYKEIKSAGAESLSIVMPEARPPSPSYQMTTPYQRDSSGAMPAPAPAFISTGGNGGGGGLPLPLILGGLAILVFVFMKGKK